MIDELEARLAKLAAQHDVITYGKLAADLGLDGPGRIARLTTALETLMAQDTAAGRPLRAALVVGRATGGLPARGFFDKAQALGHDVSDPAGFHCAQLSACFGLAAG
ncbi:hypothetical protein M3N55_04080 [Roseibaca sp. V10]|uniref:Uncharacterized protein n=1 Tax=Roseinatronobacter domitianus TaxID=2940293 RepID=A0ABT0LZ53_9RHOB|nr:hypothetical protein [Roseibaca domitiana]MCL1627899.1 hypothetical protein [Roseibaca domitiana]